MFYRGKHVAKSARSSKLNKTTLMVVSLVLLLTFVIGGTVAWIMDSTDPVVNVFEPVEVTTEIEENLTATEKTNISVKNTGEVPIYVRAKYVINWVYADGDKKGQIVENPGTGYSYELTPATGYNSTWKPINGYYYYIGTVPVGGQTANLLDKIVMTTPENPEYVLRVDIIADGIQAEPASAVEVWGVTASQLAN